MKRARVQLPVALVLVSLSSLAFLPFAVERRIAEPLSGLSGVAEPARKLIETMQLAFALEAAGTRGFLLTREPEHAEEHRKARVERKAAYAQLVQLSKGADAEFQDQVRALGEALRPADELLDGLYDGSLPPEEYIKFLPAQHLRFQEVTSRTERLTEAISRMQAAHRAEIWSAQRLQTMLAIPLVLLALGAVAAVALLESRYRAAAEREEAAHAASERAHAEADRRRVEVERVSASRQALMRGFTHDVKNPLSVTHSCLNVLEQGAHGPLTGRQGELVARARRGLDEALRLISDLLELATAESGALELHGAAFDLRENVVNVVESHRAVAERKGLALRMDSAAESLIVDSDASRVSQIVRNLVANAINYTQSGSVTVSAGAAPGRWAEVAVSDTGPGIPQEQRSLVFEEFHRLGAANGSQGSGIGLAISKRLAHALGGDITVDSEVGRGSRFVLRLPLAPQAHSDARGPAA